MNETLFSAASLVAMLGWGMLGLGAWVRTGVLRTRLLALGGRGVPLGLCLLYAGLLITHWGSAPGGGFGSLAAVMALFAVPGKMLGAWVHFLAFDLLVGRWMVDDVLSNGRSRWGLVLSLPLAFLFGPLGLLVHVLTRRAGPRPGPRLNDCSES